jgi:hypothetical protein
MGLLLAWAAGAATAADGGLAVTLLAGRLQHDAVERFPSGAEADRESGGIGDCEWRLEGPLGDGAVWARDHRWSGPVAYTGATQIGLPLQTVTQLEGRDSSAGWRQPLWRGGDVSAAALWGGGARRWRRDIAATPFSSPLSETTTQRYLLLGTAVTWQTGAGPVVSVTLSVDRPAFSRLQTDFHGAADPVTLSPGARWSPALAFDLGLPVATPLSLRLGARVQRLALGSSDAQPYRVGGIDTGSTVRYPGSVQFQRLLQIGLQLRWP